MAQVNVVLPEGSAVQKLVADLTPEFQRMRKIWGKGKVISQYYERSAAVNNGFRSPDIREEAGQHEVASEAFLKFGKFIKAVSLYFRNINLNKNTADGAQDYSDSQSRKTV